MIPTVSHFMVRFHELGGVYLDQGQERCTKLAQDMIDFRI